MRDSLSECDDMTLRVLAIIDRTTPAEQRRRPLAANAAQARQGPNVAHIVRLMLVSRRERLNGGGNVIRIEGRRGG